LEPRNIARELEYRPLGQLHLDPQNPRLPLDMRGRSRDEIAVYIERQYDALNVATSIARNGFFPSEALVIVREDDHDVVVEGNRRLVALLGLTDAELRSRYSRRRDWELMAQEAAANQAVPTEIPVVVASNRLAVAPLIGYRHITGILGWDPFSQARYVAQLVDDHHLEFEAVATMMGEQLTVIRSRYRNFKIVEQARTGFDLDVEQAESDFGVLSRALQAQGIREFIGAPWPAATRPGQDPVPRDRGAELGQLFVWLFGDAEGQGRVIGESRDVNDLGLVLASETGREVLEDTGDLASAVEAIGGLRHRLTSRLNTALRALHAAGVDIDAYRNEPEVQVLLNQLGQTLDQLRNGPTE
jgi:hypothetical protein